MGRPRKEKDGTPSVGDNGYDPAILRKFVKAIEGELATIAGLHEDIAPDVAGCRAEIKACYEQAKEAGIPVKALKAAIKVRKIERAMESDVSDGYDQIRHALGDLADTPLGRAAIGKPVGGPVGAVLNA